MLKINEEILKKVKQKEKKIVFVTKYFDADFTKSVIDTFQDNSVFAWVWENRIEVLKEKNLPSKYVHFIGNIQSRKIPDIVKFSDTIHSLVKKEHFPLLETASIKENKKINVFLQIHLDKEKQSGILVNEIDSYREEIKKYPHISLIWISAIGKYDASEEEKRQEMRILNTFKGKYPYFLISFWTSVDWEIALEEGSDILRIGKALFE